MDGIYLEQEQQLDTLLEPLGRLQLYGFFPTLLQQRSAMGAARRQPAVLELLQPDRFVALSTRSLAQGDTVLAVSYLFDEALHHRTAPCLALRGPVERCLWVESLGRYRLTVRIARYRFLAATLALSW